MVRTRNYFLWVAVQPGSAPSIRRKIAPLCGTAKAFEHSGSDVLASARRSSPSTPGERDLLAAQMRSAGQCSHDIKCQLDWHLHQVQMLMLQKPRAARALKLQGFG